MPDLNLNKKTLQEDLTCSQSSSQPWVELVKKQIAAGAWHDAIKSFAVIEAEEHLSNPQLIDQLYHAAAAAAHKGENIQSAEIHCQLLALAPQHANGLRNFSIVLRRLQAFSAAEYFIRRYVQILPSCPHGQNTYGTILADQGRHDEAIEAFKKALSFAPDYPEAHSNLANEYHLQALIDLAFIHSSLALEKCPGNAGILLDHLTHLRRVCSFTRLEQVNWWKLLRSIPPSSISSSFLQLLVLAEADNDQHDLLDAIMRWGNYQTSLVDQQVSMQLPSSRTLPLRLGFLSADFRDHSVARFIWPIFEHIDRKSFELFGYSTYRVSDQWRHRFDQCATVMRDVGALSPQELSKCIRDDQVHILFDLTGFTKGSRTGSFAWRAAPVQVGWLGFPGTSGLEQMDYLFLDRYLAPKNPNLIREKLLISRGTTVCFSQIDEVPIAQDVPELVRGHLTLGTLNNPYKYTRSTIKCWARVLQALPTAHFLFVRREFQSYWLRENLINEFAAYGIDRTRIHFFNNRLAGRHYLDCYNEIDFTLDSFPVTGGTTTTDALWMGVPVVCLEGPNVHQRVCSAILHHAGHPEWIARSHDEFLQIALDLAADQPRRLTLRQSLREELKASLLCDTRQFALDFAATMDSLRPID